MDRFFYIIGFSGNILLHNILPNEVIDVGRLLGLIITA